MLSAFTARPLVELKPRDKSRIESVLAYGDRVLVGLNNGNLRIYRVNEDEDATISNTSTNNTNNNTTTNPDTTTTTTTNPPPPNDTTTTTATTDPPPSTSTTPKPSLLREIEKFSRYKIDQLSLIKEAKLLVSLSGSYVSIHDLTTYKLVEQLTRTKGASLFAVTSNIENDAETGMPTIVSRLAVAVKRKILVWVWRDMEVVGDEGRE
ncbi:hypothetical protein BO71DRAFT_414530, partial [Aspergillus ellipticus CBS 707.79]